MEITHAMWNTPRGLRRKIAKRPKKAIFGGFKALAKSGVDVLQNKNFPVKFKVFMLY